MKPAMYPKIIHTEEKYDAALAHVESLMDAESGSTQEEELEIWTLLFPAPGPRHSRRNPRPRTG